MKTTLTIDGVTVELQLTDEQINEVKKAIEPKEKKITWEELDALEGFINCGDGNIVESSRMPILGCTTFKSLNQARSAIAMAKLSHLMAHEYYNGGWEPNWHSESTYKYVINHSGDSTQNGGIYTTIALYVAHFLAFKDAETRDRFLKHHRELIEEYFLMYQ